MKNTRIQFIVGFVLGALVFSSVTALATNGGTVTAVFSKFNFIINGEEREIDAEILVHDGRSYLPVRAMGEELGYKVDYDGDTRTIFLSNKEGGLEERDGSITNQLSNSSDGTVVEELGTMFMEIVTVCDKYPEVGSINDCLESHEEYGDFDFDRLKEAIENGQVNVNDYDENGNSLLHFAAEKDNYYVIEFLINNGANVNAQNNDGDTALHIFAKYSDSTSSLILLYKAGVSTQIKDNQGKLPIDYVEKYSGIWSSLRMHREDS